MAAAISAITKTTFITAGQIFILHKKQMVAIESKCNQLRNTTFGCLSLLVHFIIPDAYQLVAHPCMGQSTA